MYFRQKILDISPIEITVPSREVGENFRLFYFSSYRRIFRITFCISRFHSWLCLRNAFQLSMACQAVRSRVAKFMARKSRFVVWYSTFDLRNIVGPGFSLARCLIERLEGFPTENRPALWSLSFLSR